MEVNVSELKKLAESRRWSLPELAEKLAVEYSFLYRIIQGERKPGGKFYRGLMLLCIEEGLDFAQFVNLEKKQAE